MGIHIDSDEFARLARRLADRRGTSVDAALIELVRRELGEVAALDGSDPHRTSDPEVARRRSLIRNIQERLAAAPTLDARPYREILYDEDGLPQ